jgi:phosphonate transport system substrate-binding protein
MILPRIAIGGLLLTVLACRANEPAPAPPPPAPSPEVAATPSPTPEAPPLTFGLGIPFGVAANQESVAILGDYFTARLKRPVQVRLFAYEELGRALAANEVDFAFISPVPYVKATEQSPVRIVRRALHHGGSSYVSVLFVKSSSRIKAIEDLKGKKVAWVQEGSASGNLFPRAALASRKIKLGSFFRDQLYLQDHAKVCEAVLEGRADVGASFVNLSRDGGRPNLGEQLIEGCHIANVGDVHSFRVIFASEPIPNDVIAVRAGAPTTLDDELGPLLDAMPSFPAGTRALREGFFADGFVRGLDADFNPVRDMLKAIEQPQ